MGEARRRREVEQEVLAVDTFGGRVQLRWEEESAATPLGQLAFFVEFLKASGLYERWVEECPLHYTSPNAASKHDVLGTLLLSILAGHKRYAHVSAIRSDEVSPGILGMRSVISDDALARALRAIAEDEGVAWLDEQFKRCTEHALKLPWILDLDTTIKPLYGRQEGALIGFNPKKPGRPSHAYHSYLMSGLRLVLEVEVSAGDKMSYRHALPGLIALLERLPKEQQPWLVRGDCGFGNEPTLELLEQRNLSYLFKLRLTQNVKKLLRDLFWHTDWVAAGQGWSGREAKLKLHGWSRERRVTVLRRALKGELLLSDEQQQLSLAFVEPDRPYKAYEYAVLVSNLPHELLTLAQLYRDRADCENSFDELKNQWGWGGYTTQDLHRCRLAAKNVALVYNWWSWFVRLANPKARLEAITSRPFLLYAIGRRSHHAGQTHLAITSLHAARELAKSCFSRIHALLGEIKQTAAQLAHLDCWGLIVQRIIALVIAAKPRSRPLLMPMATANCGI
jgi:Transposase DDE domain group 1